MNDKPVEINVEVVAMMPSEIPERETTLQVNYYPIQCVESNRSIYGTISYNFQGKQNEPNLIYVNPGDTTQFGRNYVAKELFVLPYRESFREFPFLANCSIPETANGALIVSNYAVTNSVEPIYTIFFIINTTIDAKFSDDKIHEESMKQVWPLFDQDAVGADGMKRWTQSEPHMLTLNDFIKKKIEMFDLSPKLFTVDKYQIDHKGAKCIIAICDVMIPIFQPIYNKNSVMETTTNGATKSVAEILPTNIQSTNVGSEILTEGFADSTGDVGEDVSNLLGNMFTGMAANPAGNDSNIFGSETTLATIKIPLHDDPNYSYQECTMVPIDDMNAETEYVYQVAKSSPMISNKSITIQGNLLTYLIAYFIMFLLTYFGVPFIYSFLMCTILKRGYNYTGYTAFIDFLKRPQNVFGLGKYSGIAVVFNLIYWFIALSSFFYGSITIVVWYIIMWIVGYIGIANNPLPESCMFS